MMAAGVLDAVRELGGELSLEGDKLRYRLPDCAEARELLAQVRRDREAIKALLRDEQDLAPSLEQVKAALPSGVTLLAYHSKQPPFAVAPISIVTNAGKFFRAYLRDLAWRIEHPETYAAPPLADILSKLADAGLELRIEREG